MSVSMATNGGGQVRITGTIVPPYRRIEVSEEGSEGGYTVVVRAYAESLPAARNHLIQDVLTRYASQSPLEVAWPAPDSGAVPIVPDPPAPPPSTPAPHRGRRTGRPRKAVR